MCQPELGQVCLFRASPGPCGSKRHLGGVNTLQIPLKDPTQSTSVSLSGLAVDMVELLGAGFSLTAWTAELLSPALRPSHPCTCWLKSWGIWQSVPPRSAPGQHRLFQPIKLISIQPWWVQGHLFLQEHLQQIDHLKITQKIKPNQKKKTQITQKTTKPHTIL